MPKYFTHREEIVRRVAAGEVLTRVAADLGVSIAVIKDAWGSHHSGDPAGAAPEHPHRDSLPEQYAERVATIYHQTGKSFDEISGELGITRTSAERAHNLWHEQNPDKPGDIPHEAVCARGGKISPDLRRKILERLQADRTSAEVAVELGLAKDDVRLVQIYWSQYNRKRGTALERRGCRRWRK